MDGLLDTRTISLAMAASPLLAGAVGFFVGAAAAAFLLRRRESAAPPVPAPPSPRAPAKPRPGIGEGRPAPQRESVGALAGGVAHDFHNLLTVILAHVDRAADRLPPQHDARAILGDVLAPVREAAGLTRALLRLTQDPTGERVPIDIVSLTRDSVRLLRRLLPASVTLSESFPERPLWIADDPTRIQRLLVDFVVQARDSAPDGGPLALELVHEAGEGRGDAVLRVKDARGEVSQREARFPLGAPPEGDDAEPRLPVKRGEGELVLIAEDDEFVREILITALEDGGYRVVSAVDGPSAIEIADREKDDLRLAILDIDLPGYSGPRIRDALRERAPDLPILFVTGGGFSSDTPEAGRDPVLQKPFTMERLVRVAHDMLHPSGQASNESR